MNLKLVFKRKASNSSFLQKNALTNFQLSFNDENLWWNWLLFT